MHAILYSINLTVCVDEFDKICQYYFAVTLHFVKRTLMYGAGDYKMVHSCGRQ